MTLESTNLSEREQFGLLFIAHEESTGHKLGLFASGGHKMEYFGLIAMMFYAKCLVT